MNGNASDPVIRVVHMSQKYLIGVRTILVGRRKKNHFIQKESVVYNYATMLLHNLIFWNFAMAAVKKRKLRCNMLKVEPDDDE